MISTTDGDSDGWIGQFNFPDNTHKQGPDCNDGDATIYPGAAEPPCLGDRNCDGRSTCNRECQSNADCAGHAGGACCSFAPNFVCQQCQGTCVVSSECSATHCCQRQGGTTSCVTATGPNQCQCATTSECAPQGAAACCVSNQNTSGQLVPGTCGDVEYWLMTHP